MPYIEMNEPRIRIELYIRREDLLLTGIAEHELIQLADADLERIAQAVINHFASDALWDEMEFMARSLLQNKDVLLFDKA